MIDALADHLAEHGVRPTSRPPRPVMQLRGRCRVDPTTATLFRALAKWRDSYACDQSFEGSEDARLAHAFDAWRAKR